MVQTWQPILVGDEAKRALLLAETIADTVAAAEQADPFALLLDAYLAIERDSEKHAERALTALEVMAERDHGGHTVALFGGLTGFGFACEHVYRVLDAWIEPDSVDSLDELDLALAKRVRTYPAHGNYDLIGGLAGVATYAAERLPRQPARELLGLVVERLETDSERRSIGRAWHTRPEHLPEHQRVDAPEGYYNLGVAHGVAGLVPLLARAAAEGICADSARPLAVEAMRWISAQQGATGDGARFASWVPVGRPPPRETREAWCYGGLGMSVSMLAAARLLRDAEWDRVATDFARLEASRPTEGSGVVDCSVCHGAAGNGHLYNRLFQATGDETFRHAARKWLLQAMDPRHAGEAGREYVFRMPEPGRRTTTLGWHRSAGFLVGASGVGLALLAAASHHEPAWDRVLAAAIPFDPRPTEIA
jgi:lantibiotic biosynthesis protein